MIINILKVVGVIWVVLIIVGITINIVMKSRISKLKRTDPKAAVEAADKGFRSTILDSDIYVKQLTKIAEETGYVGAMLSLAEYYTGKAEKSKKDDEKHKYWRLRAAKAGNIDCIIEIYGFTDFDIASDDYAGMMAALNNAKLASTTEETVAETSYCLGLANYKMGNFDVAGQTFASISYPELAENSRYMMVRCLIGQNNISEADKLLETLDASKAPLSAADYLAMYNFYATDTGTQSYEKVAEYAQKYIACEGSDRKKGYEMGGVAYYNLAKAYQDGLDGREADARKSLNYYEQAAKFENVEALYYLGEGYWSGRLLRNYSSANKYLSKAAEKGHKQSQNILREYGVNSILVKSKDPAQRTYYFRNGYKLVASAKTMKWMQLCAGTAYMEKRLSEEFVNNYNASFTSFDQLVDGVHQLYSNQLAKMVQWGTDVLMAFGIDSYSASDILEESGDLSLLPRVGSFERKIQAIDRRAEQLHLNQSYAKATRTRWTGSGFGTTISGTIKATVKANVAAGMMNVGSGILHGIGDSISKAIDNAEIRKMGKEVFQDPYTLAEFKSAVSSACQEIASTLLTIVEENTDYVNMEHLQGKIVFEGENLAGIDDKTLSAKIENNIRAHNDEYTYALMLEGLRRNPHDKNYFEPLVLLSFQMGVGEGSKEYDSLIRYPRDFIINTSRVADSFGKIIQENA